MKTLLIATTATLALAVSISPNLVSQSAAAHANSAYCNMAKSQRNPVSWNARYKCFDKERQAAARARAEAPPARNIHAKNSYCDMAKSQKNPVAWNAKYGCLNR